jgi:pilus assembly protein CpaB
MGNETKSLWISVAAGLFAAFLLYSYSQEKKAEWDKKFGNTKNVVVAQIDIDEMVTIDDTMLTVVQRPAEFIEPGALTDIDAAIGQVAATPIRKDEQVLEQKLLNPGPDTGIALQVAPTKRAVTIPVTEISGIGKLIRPGDRVDIVAAIDTGRGANQRREVQVMMQDAVVLATGKSIMNNIPRLIERDAGSKDVRLLSLTGDSTYTSITIEATPKEAQDLIYILSTSPGNIYFTLRNPNDRSNNRLPASTIESLTGKPVTVGAELGGFGGLPAGGSPSVPAGVFPTRTSPPPSQNNTGSGNFKGL